MGRKAMPIELLLINGNKNKLTKQEINARKKSEEKIKPNANNIKPPSWLNASAKREFRKLAQELAQIGLMTNVDVNQLAVYCRTYARYIELQKGVEDKETGEFITDEKTIDMLYKQLKGMAVEFGFTPSARAKLAMPKEEEKEKSTEEKMFGDV